MSLIVRNLSYTYSRSGRGCRNVSFEAGVHQVVGLVGPSGSGKSTALACIAGVLTGGSGSVSVVGEAEPMISLALQAAPLFEGLRLWENVAVAWGYPSRRARTDAVAALAEVGLADLADAFPSSLSGGQRQRGAVAAALAQDSDVMLFDEPTGNLDDVNADRVVQALRLSARQGRVVVLATHDRRVIDQLDAVVELEGQGS